MSDGWSEPDSALYLRLADAAVPRRAEQMAALATLLPFGRDASARIVELGCGPGALTHALLDLFSGARVIALDGSASMLAHARDRLGAFAKRVELRRFRLSSPDWLDVLDGADAVLSSLCLHHLDGPGKKRLFAEVGARLSPAGAFVVADLVAPGSAAAEALFRETWDGYARRAAPELWELFEREQWNHYRFPDPADQPSGLFEQLCWLAGAGLDGVDCFWMDAGHAVFGGYRGSRAEGSDLSFAEALEAARRGIEATR